MSLPFEKVYIPLAVVYYATRSMSRQEVFANIYPGFCAIIAGIISSSKGGRMGTGFKKLAKLLTAQIFIGVLHPVLNALIEIFLHEGVKVRHILDIVFIGLIIVVGSMTAFTLHSLRRFDGSFRTAGALCFFAAVFEALLQMTSDMNLYMVIRSALLVFTGWYVLSLLSVLIKKAEGERYKKLTKLRKAYIILFSISLMATLLLRVFDILAMALIALAVIPEIVLAVVFIKRLKEVVAD